MRVTIQHREEAEGAGRSRRNYFVDCSVEFSEEEKAIIKVRDLSRRSFDVPAATPPPSMGRMVGTGAMRGLGPLVAVAGLVLTFFRGAYEVLGGYMLVGGIGFAIYGWLRQRREDKRIELPAQTITIGGLLANQRFTVHAGDPAEAKAMDEEIRGYLVGMKDLIRGSAELGSKQTFEL